MAKKILLASGGTGGHFFPAIAAGNALKESGYDVYMVTDERCRKYTQNIDYINFKIIDIYISSSNILRKAISALKLGWAVLKSYLYLRSLKPDLVIGFGGYPSFPCLYAARLLSIPIALHEQNSFLGKVNRYFAKDAKVIMSSYPAQVSDKNIKTEFIGDIVRPEIKNLNKQISNKNSLSDRSDLDQNDLDQNNSDQVSKKEALRVTIFGGSAGAKIFSEVVPAAFVLASKRANKKANKGFKCKIIQQAKQEDHKKISSIYDALGFEYELSEFFYNMDEVYANTDLVISRSGASSIAELAALRLPAIFIPYPYAAEDHQLKNAKQIEQMGGGWCFKQVISNGSSNSSELSDQIAGLLLKISENEDLLKNASNNLKSRKTDGHQALLATVNRIL